MITQANIEATIRAWQTASSELSFEVVAPFALRVETRVHQCLAWVPYFSGRRGNIVVAAELPYMPVDPIFKRDAAISQYSVSILDVKSYRAYDRTRFIEMLNEWGYYGPPDKCPSWCVEGNYSATWKPEVPK